MNFRKTKKQKKIDFRTRDILPAKRDISRATRNILLATRDTRRLDYLEYAYTLSESRLF